MARDLLGPAANAERVAGEMAYALGGLTLAEARHVARQALHGGRASARALFAALHDAKRRLARRSAFLEYVPATPELEQVGGLSYLRAWIAKRAGIFNRSAAAQGLPLPRGILIMGVSGCGKSLCAKVVAQTWRVPLFRLDMNLVFSNLHGNPEASFHNALRAIESAAPAVLWIDEIEDGLGLESAAARPTHILSAFLTWMQEKPPLVFVAATANRIEALPAELIRKGRFDQVFFCDLPEPPEREEVFRIHLKAGGADPAAFELARLVRATEGWTAAEIAQAVETARVEALGEKRAFGTRDILDYAASVVPLSRTMSEQIKRIRDWAWDRATPASRQSARELTLDK
jgi:SpoVK/Ycf46/Vps4 family AAA+-type ATPase